MSKMLTSICFILKQSGVHTMKMTIQEKYAFTHITGKITVASLIYLITKRRCAHIGLRMTKLLPTSKVVLSSTCAVTLTAGKNKSSTQTTSKQTAAITGLNVKRIIVLISIQMTSEGILCLHVTKYCPKQEMPHSHLIFTLTKC